MFSLSEYNFTWMCLPTPHLLGSPHFVLAESALLEISLFSSSLRCRRFCCDCASLGTIVFPSLYSPIWPQGILPLPLHLPSCLHSNSGGRCRSVCFSFFSHYSCFPICICPLSTCETTVWRPQRCCVLVVFFAMCTQYPIPHRHWWSDEVVGLFLSIAKSMQPPYTELDLVPQVSKLDEVPSEPFAVHAVWWLFCAAAAWLGSR